MSIKNIIKVLLLSLATQSCDVPDLKTKSGEENTLSENWSFDTWGDDCSNQLDQHPCNFELFDTEENIVNLYDFYGSPIVLDFSAMWCGPCQYAALEVEDIKSEFPEIVYITVLIDNEYGDPPTTEDLRRWADIFGINEPVLGGNRDMMSDNPDMGWPISSWPTFFYINSEMLIEHTHTGYSSSTVRQNITYLLR